MVRLTTEITPQDWIKWSKSVWTFKPNSQWDTEWEKPIIRKHPAKFPMELVRRCLLLNTKKGDKVLDPFGGIGTTLVTSAINKRSCASIELQTKYTRLTREWLNWVENEKGVDFLYDLDNINDDARNVLDYVKEDSVDFVMTSPPYGNVMSRKRSWHTDGNPIHQKGKRYSTDKADIGNISDYKEFLDNLCVIFTDVVKCLKGGRRMVVVVKDIRERDRLVPYHMDVVKMLRKLHLKLHHIIIWNRDMDYHTNAALCGYPKRWIGYNIHEYIMFFQKGVEI